MAERFHRCNHLSEAIYVDLLESAVYTELLANPGRLESKVPPAQKLADASAVIGHHPMALQLRFLQTLTEMASENNSTTSSPCRST